MSSNFLDHIRGVEDGRIAGMTTYPLDEVLLTVLVGLSCRMEDFDEISMFGEEQIDWLRRFLPFENGVAPAQTLRRALRALDPKALQAAFSSWVASLKTKVSGVVAIDAKTLRGSKHGKSGAGALHVVPAYAHEAGSCLPRGRWRRSATRLSRFRNSSTCWRSRAPSSPSPPWERKRPSPPKSSRKRPITSSH